MMFPKWKTKEEKKYGSLDVQEKEIQYNIFTYGTIGMDDCGVSICVRVEFLCDE